MVRSRDLQPGIEMLKPSVTYYMQALGRSLSCSATGMGAGAWDPSNNSD